jgi:hypothetical protein
MRHRLRAKAAGNSDSPDLRSSSGLGVEDPPGS